MSPQTVRERHDSGIRACFMRRHFRSSPYKRTCLPGRNIQTRQAPPILCDDLRTRSETTRPKDDIFTLRRSEKRCVPPTPVVLRR
jgi:hypothetical protein